MYMLLDVVLLTIFHSVCNAHFVVKINKYNCLQLYADTGELKCACISGTEGDNVHNA